MLVQMDDVRAILTECFGTALTERSGLVPETTGILRAWVPGVDPPVRLAKHLEDAVFNGLFGLLGPKLQVQPKQGTPWRIPLDALPEVADRLMSIVFMGLGAYAGNYAMLRQYAMEHGSNAALYTLYQHFSAFQPDEERAVERRILAEAGWLSSEKGMHE